MEVIGTMGIYPQVRPPGVNSFMWLSSFLGSVSQEGLQAPDHGMDVLPLAECSMRVHVTLLHQGSFK